MLRAFFFGLILALPLVWFFRLQETEKVAAWWDDAWHYRQRVDVTNNTLEETDVYISLTLDTSDTTKFQADCGDLRFTKQNGQLMDYYIASGCGTVSTSIHVQFDIFPAGAQSIYAYYGNAAAEDGFASADFSTEASNYTIGGVASEEVGPGPVAYWKFDEGSGTTAFDSANYGLGDELLTDGDMEAADTSAWRIAGSDPVLSKQTLNPHGGTRVLRVASNNSNQAWAQPETDILTAGKRYRLTGYARGDGSQSPGVYNGSVYVFAGSPATEWQYFDIEFVAPTSKIYFYKRTSTGIGYAEFDDVSIKEVVSGNQGTITGATWASEDQCVSGKCLSFDGVDDYVDYGDTLDLNNDFTISAWAKPTNLDGKHFIVSKGDEYGQYHYEIRYWNGVLGFNVYAEGTDATPFCSVTIEYDKNSLLNNWSHFVGRVDEGTGCYLYLDGEQIANDLTLTGTIRENSTDPLMVGIRGGDEWAGLIDEVKIFPYALTEDQIKNEYNLGAAAVIGTGPLVTLPSNGTLKDSLVAHWSFDEQAGQTVHDKVGGNDGTRGADANAGSDDPTWKPANECKVNGCASFDGGDYVDAGNDSALNPTSEMTISAWFYISSLPVTAVEKWIVGRDEFGGRSYALGIENSQGIVGADLQINGGNTIAASTDTQVTAGQWHYLAVTGDSSNGWVMYLDGKQVATASWVAPNSSSTNTNIGRRSYSTATGNFDGLIDEVKIYNTALTADQVRQDMNAGASVSYSVGQDEANDLTDGAGDPPVAEWRFDEKQGATAYDTSGNENNGTVNGATWKSAARCHQGACLEFDGDGDYMSTDFLGGAAPFSISLWAKGTTGYLIYQGVSAGSSLRHRMFVSGGTLTWEYFDGAWKEVTTAWPENTWNHIEIVKTSSLMSLYLDGILKGSISAGSTADYGIFMIGARGSVANYFNGFIDHVKIYDYARTPAQIAYDYNRGKPIAHWKFDECEGTVAHDSSGNDNHGTINIGASGSQTKVGTCETSAAWGNGAEGKFNGSLGFDGTDDFISLSSPNSIPIGSSAYTISAWIFANAMGNRGIVGWGNFGTANQVNALRLSPTGIINYWWGNDLAVTTGDITGVWHHVVASFDGTTRIIYLDGTEVGRRTAGGLDIPSANNFQIGKTNVNEYFDGQIDDVRIYNYALSPAQVQKVMNEGMAVRYGPVLGGQ